MSHNETHRSSPPNRHRQVGKPEPSNLVKSASSSREPSEPRRTREDRTPLSAWWREIIRVPEILLILLAFMIFLMITLWGISTGRDHIVSVSHNAVGLYLLLYFLHHWSDVG